jgi:hypothetical protein
VAHLDDAAGVAAMMLASAVSISDALERVG